MQIYIYTHIHNLNRIDKIYFECDWYDTDSKFILHDITQFFGKNYG